MSSKNEYSKKILKILSKKPAISLKDIKKGFFDKEVSSKKTQYAITRSLKNLEDSGMIEQISSDQKKYARITKEGKKKAHSINLDSDTTLVNLNWDGYWRIVILDLPEERKSERESLRYLLKKAGFVCIKNSVWISMMPYEHLFTNIKKDLDFTTELMVMVTNKIDKKTEDSFLSSLGFIS